MVTSLTWSPLQTNHLAIGTSTGRVLLYDTQATRRLRDDLTSHESRVGALAWSGSSCLASGSRDRNILLQDTRSPSSTNNNNVSNSSSGSGERARGYSAVGEREGMMQVVFSSPMLPPPPLTAASAAATAMAAEFVMPLIPSSSSFLLSPQSPFASLNNSTASAASSSSTTRYLRGHRQEICGLKWSFDDKLLASGGNDNKLFVWHPSHLTDKPLFQFEDHIAAVKAVAWSPHQGGLLASGGGTADRHIRFWSTATGLPLYKVDTGSQVCNLMWSRTVNEIVSTHGYSLNQV